jgi:hypothetical protein
MTIQYKGIGPGIYVNKKYLMFIISIFFLLTAVFSLNLFYSGSASGSEKTDFLAIGEAWIKGNNMADARKEAISNALKKGMEEYLNLNLGTQGMVSNFSILINEIVPIAVEEIENYHILAEEKKDENYSILVRVKINEKLMEQRLRERGIVSIENTSIKILFLVVQEKAAGKDSSFWWNNPDINPALTTTELKLYNIFQDQGFEPVNRLSVPSHEKYSEDMIKRDISNEAAIEWGKLFSADIIIKGKSSLSVDNMVAVDLEAISVKDGKSICRAGNSERSSPVGSGENSFTNALDTAINNIAIQFSPEIIKSFAQKEREANSILVTLQDLNNFDEFIAFKKFLEKEIGGIKSVVQSRVKRNSMSLSVEYYGTKEAFLNKLKGYEGFPLKAEITDGKDGDLIIKIEHEIIDPSDNLNILQQD